MNAITRKEIRLLAPAALAGLLVAALPLIFGLIQQQFEPYHQTSRPCQPLTATSLALCGLGALIVSIAVFGQEVAGGTLGLFMVQPLQRKELWRIKMRVMWLGVAVALAVPVVYSLINSHLGIGPHRSILIVLQHWLVVFLDPLLILIVALACISGGLWTTLVFRQVTAAFWIALLVPLALIAPLQFLEHFPSLVQWVGQIILAVLLVYGIAGFWLARRLFLTAQDISWTGGTLSFSFKRTTWLAPLAWLPRSPAVSLIHKELQLQQVAIFVAAAMVVFQLAMFALHKLVRPESSWFQILELGWILWFVVPLAVGGSAVAEERRMNTLEGALCLPVPRRTQFIIKFVVTIFLGTLLGGVLPTASLCLGGLWLRGPQDAASAKDLAQLWLGCCGAAAGLTLVCFYGSTLTRNVLQALAATVAIVAGVALVGRVLVALPNFVIGNHDVSPTVFWNPWFVWVGGGILAAILLSWLPYRNFAQARPPGKLWRFNLSTIGIGLVSFSVLNLAIMERTWELFIPIEPRHGAPCLAGLVQPKLVDRYGLLLALLPDGRLWLAQKMETRLVRDVIRTKTNGVELMVAHVPMVPLSGVFVGPSNWVDVAAAGNEAVAVQADGSLWRISAGYLDCMKEYVTSNRVQANGALWRAARRGDDYETWRQEENLSARSPDGFSLSPQIYTAKAPVLERIGTDSDWKSVQAGARFILALKKDGTLWGWGTNNSGVLGPAVEKETNCPVHIGKDSDWVCVLASYWNCTAFKRDGSEWRWGSLYVGPNGEVASEKNWSDHHVEPVRYPLSGTNWTSISPWGSIEYAVNGDGSLWSWGKWAGDPFSSRPFWSFRSQWGGIWTNHPPTRIGAPGEWRSMAGFVLIKRDGTLWTDSFGGRSFLQKKSRYADWIAIRPGNWQEAMALAADGTISHWAYPTDDLREANGMLPTRKPEWNLNILEAKNIQ